MTEHYYSNQPQSQHDLKTITCKLRNHHFTFTTDAGVFSKGREDFGSTLLINTFEIDDKLVGDFLDLGCGYGPIGISLAKDFPKRDVLLIDVNERAVTLARKNAKQNDVNNIDVLQSDGFTSVENHKF